MSKKRTADHVASEYIHDASIGRMASELRSEFNASRANKRARAQEIVGELSRTLNMLVSLRNNMPSDRDVSKETKKAIEDEFRELCSVTPVPHTVQHRNPAAFPPKSIYAANNPPSADEVAKFAERDKKVVDRYKQQVERRAKAIKTIVSDCDDAGNDSTTPEIRADFERLKKAIAEQLNYLHLPAAVPVQQQINFNNNL